MDNKLASLHPYPFEKLAQLKTGVTPKTDAKHIALSIGEPQHKPPHMVLEALTQALPQLAKYPTTKGLPQLRETIAAWLTQRFSLTAIDPNSQILPVNGTREALFAFAQAVVDTTVNHQPLVVSPNPFYQIYEGAAILAGADIHFLNCLSESQFIPNFDEVPADVWERCQLIYLCTPGNPSGAVLPMDTLQQLITLADRHDFIIASDECYSEIYPDEKNPPVGLLQACEAMGRRNYERCVVFHSLSKRSNLPGLRSGFVAGDASVLAEFLRYRTYHGCAMSLPTQQASITAWSDEQHVQENRQRYNKKFTLFKDILGGTLPLTLPDAGFYFWTDVTPAGLGNDEQFARHLFEQANITVLPGSFLSRTADGINPGKNHIRMALVASIEECKEAATRIKSVIEQA